MKYKHTSVKKFEGDDSYSWAVFVRGKPAVTGLTKSQTKYYRDMIELRETTKEGITK
mgnify:CR=1 FL=1